jgi:hypothetical protein
LTGIYGIQRTDVGQLSRQHWPTMVKKLACGLTL